jgi:hypothetical protein
LKKVSRKLSLHDEDDLRALNAPYQTVYAYDVEKEREVPFDTAVKEAEFPIETAETASEFNWLAKRDEDRIDFPEMPAKAPKEPMSGRAHYSRHCICGCAARRSS